MKDFRYMAIVAAAAVGLAVAGCGSSGSDDDTASTPAVTPPTQAELDAEKARADAEKARADAEKARADEAERKAGAATARALHTALGAADPDPAPAVTITARNAAQPKVMAKLGTDGPDLEFGPAEGSADPISGWQGWMQDRKGAGEGPPTKW